jgi:hypothetical protein
MQTEPQPESLAGHRAFASDDTVWPYSFANICAMLDLDVGCVRRAVGGRPR